jgi:hypothetical protein
MDTAQLYEFDVNGAHPSRAAPLFALVLRFVSSCPGVDWFRAAQRRGAACFCLPASVCITGCHAGVIVIKNMIEPAVIDKMNTLLDADTAAEASGYDTAAAALSSRLTHLSVSLHFSYGDL